MRMKENESTGGSKLKQIAMNGDEQIAVDRYKQIVA